MPVIELRPGLTKEVKKRGQGSMPVTGQTVAVHYTGTLEDGRVFDSSKECGQPIKFVLGASQVILGWDLGVSTMAVGECAVLVIAPEYAYGMNETGPIPAGSTLRFEVELVSATDPDALKVPKSFIVGLGATFILAICVVIHYFPSAVKAMHNTASGRDPAYGM